MPGGDRVLNGRGGNWSPAETPDGLEMGIDRVAFARAVTDRRRASPDDRLNMQVTKVIKDSRVFQTLSKSGSIADYTMETAVSAIRHAIEAKALKPTGQKDDIILVLDAIEIMLAAVDPVVQAFRRLHDEWARSLGFSTIWVAAGGNQSFQLI